MNYAITVDIVVLTTPEMYPLDRFFVCTGSVGLIFIKDWRYWAGNGESNALLPIFVNVETLLLRLFLRGFLRFFLHGFLCLFLRGFLRLFLRGFLRLFSRGFLRLFFRGFLRRFLRGFLRRFFRSFLRRFFRSFLRRFFRGFLRRFFRYLLRRFRSCFFLGSFLFFFALFLFLHHYQLHHIADLLLFPLHRLL